MEKLVKIITKSGNEITLREWQKHYGLTVDSSQIGQYYSLEERIFSRDLEDYGQLIVNELLIKVLDRFRSKVKQPVNINAFNRNASKQAQLRAQGLRAAKYSPHEVFMAADIDTQSNEQTDTWVKVLREVSKELDIKIRIGYEDYKKDGSTFIHVDVCPEFYGNGKPFNAVKHPVQWENSIEW